ncbi:MAG TPA: voltage-gated potassium channel protein [Burkholderiaceae bacterium]|nr:voltage-gated potassium channel protein [Burkholderiaceae bacterium]
MRVVWLRNQIRRLYAAFPLHWFVAVLVAIDGFTFLQPGVSAVRAAQPQSWLSWFSFEHLRLFLDSVGLVEIPRLILGVSLQIMAIGLILRARIAWAFSLLLLIVTGTIALWSGGHDHLGLAAYTLALVLMLIAYWRRFDRSSLAAGSLFAVLSILSLLVYAVFGALYLGDEFQPPIHDIVSALYFAVVSMSTVGYGDITPHTASSRLFTVSIIIMGITVFATSVSAIIGPIIGGNLKRLVKGRLNNVMRKNHIIIAGATPLAQSVYKGMRARGFDVTVIVPEDVSHVYPEGADLIVGDPSEESALTEAGAAKAKYILALRNDDAENAFIVLAAKEVGGPDTKTVALANTTTHLEKIKRVGPDMVLSLQLLGGEVLSRTLSGEPLDSEMISHMLFAETAAPNVVS